MAGVFTRIRDAVRAPVQPPVPARRAVRDSIVNPITGMGGTMDATAHNRLFARRLTQYEIDQAYAGSQWMRKLIDLPAKEQVRARRDWQADKPTIAKLEAEEKRLGLWAKIKRAEILRGLGGGAIVIWIDGDDPTTPLDPKRIRAGGLTSLSVWSRWQMVLGEKIFDLSSPWHGQPTYYEIASLNLITQTFGIVSSTTLKLHPSRVVAFRGEEVGVPMGSDWYDEFWGASKVEVALHAVLNCDAAQAGFAGLVKDAVNVIIGIPGMTEMMATEEGKEILQGRTDAVTLGKSIWRAIFFDSGAGGKDAETVTYREQNWAGIPDVLMVFIYPVAASGNMPATVMLGKSPDGMNATGNGDLQIWDREVDSRREVEMRPNLEHIDVALVPSALGKPDDTIWWEYGALSTPSALEQGQTAFAKAQAIAIYADRNLVASLPFEKGVANMLIEDRLLPGLDDALDEMPEDERYPSLTADEPEVDANGDPVDPSAITQPGAKSSSTGRKAGDPSLAQAGVNGSAPARRAANDARFNDADPRTMYVQRKLLNATDLIRWAKSQGFETTTPADEMHVTVAFSRVPLDWMTIGQDWSSDKDGNLTVPAGGPRIVQPLGDKGAVVLLFGSNDLTYRHKCIVDAGASWDFPEYQPHVTITYQAPAGLDLSKVQPYVGPLKFGPELFSEVQDGWEQTVTEE